ncbi:MAG: Hsp33 family molecular chaperone [Xanthobacteraceae bacterium]|nr:Hsp33 family molecular chaperone [Xanthobacteraceae bacterium]
MADHASIHVPSASIRAPSAVPVDDAVLPFEVSALDVRGRLTKMGPALDEILTKHDYPVPVGKLLGEAIVLTTLLGSSLKFDGRFILQTQTDGAVSLIVVDYIAPDRLRAYARYDAARVTPNLTSAALLGHGHLAMTIDQGPDMSRYQGLVALTGGNLEDAAHEYFLRSEQIPTRVRLAVGEEFRGGAGPKHRWRGGGMLMQFLPKAPERARQADLHPGDAPEGSEVHAVAEDDAWLESQSLFATIEDVELIDPDLSGERLLFRLFHERGVRVFPNQPISARCTCSREAVSGMLASFEPRDRADMVENGKVVVTCEFCNSTYEFTPQEAGVEEPT